MVLFPDPRILKREDPVTYRYPPLTTQATLTGCSFTACISITAELDRGLRGHAGQPLLHRWRHLCRVWAFFPSIRQQVYWIAETIPRCSDSQSRELASPIEEYLMYLIPLLSLLKPFNPFLDFYWVSSVCPVLYKVWSLPIKSFPCKMHTYMCGFVCVLTHTCTCVYVYCSPPGSNVHGILQARILAWVAHALLQGIFPTQGSNPGFPCCRCIHFHLSHQGNPRILK